MLMFDWFHFQPWHLNISSFILPWPLLTYRVLEVYHKNLTDKENLLQNSK